MNELRFEESNLAQTHAATMDDINNKVKELDALLTDKPDPQWETLSLSMISHL